jgi:hypothetical protein
VSKVFVTYRREDSGPITRRSAFGPNAAFIDADTIRSVANHLGYRPSGDVQGH